MLWAASYYRDYLDNSLPEPKGPPWGLFEGPLEGIPVGRGEMLRVYGGPLFSYSYQGRKVRVSRRWKRRNMVLAKGLPVVPRGKLYVHRLVEPYLREGLRRVIEVEPDWRPKRVGCFAPRHQRHDSSRPLSDHTFGCAIDFSDPDGKFRRERSSVSDRVAEALKSVGFDWGGDWNWRDEMHFSLRRL